MKLAIDGGSPVRRSAWPPWPHYDASDIQAVGAVLDSGKVNYWSGDIERDSDRVFHGLVGQFEKAFAAVVGCRYGIAVANGTLGLELALEAAGIGAGDEVIVPNRTFIATASCCVQRGAIPVFADVARDSQNLAAETVVSKITPKTKAIIGVHLAGRPCEMDALMALAREKNLVFIEDCAQALGARYKDRPVGSLGHVAAFSFCQDKIISTGGEGGMLTTNDREIYQRAWRYKDHGKDFDQHQRGLKGRTLYSGCGTNWRMTQMQAALGLKALEKLPQWLAKRAELAALLTKELNLISGLQVPPLPDHMQHANYKLYAYLDAERLKPEWDRERLIPAIKAEGVGPGVDFGTPWHIGGEPLWQETQIVGHPEPLNLRLAQPFENDAWLGQRVMQYTVHPTMEITDVMDQVHATRKVLGIALREA